MSLLSLGRGLGSAAMHINAPRPVFSYITAKGDTIPATVPLSAVGNITEGTIVVEYRDDNPRSSSDGYQNIFYLGTSGSSNQVALVKYMANGELLFRVTRNNTHYLKFDYKPDAIVPGRTNRIALSFKAGGVAVALNGIVIATHNTNLMPASFADGFGIGQLAQGGNIFAGDISEFSFYDKALSVHDVRRLSRKTDIVDAEFSVARDIIAFMGQSNSLGDGSLVEAPSYTHAIKLLSKDLSQGIENYVDPYGYAANPTFANLFNSTNNKFSYGGVVCDAVMGITGRETVALPVNMGGTGLVDPANWGVINEVTGQSVMNERSYAAIKTLQTAQQFGNLKAVVWHQGETDAASGVSGTNYTSVLTDFYNVIRRHVGNVPIITIALHDEPPSGYLTWNDIQTAQKAFTYPNHTVVSAEGKEAQSGNETHLSATGLIDLGGDIANAITA